MTSEIRPASTQSIVDALEYGRGRIRPAEFHDPAPDMRGVFVHKRAIGVTN